MNLGSNGVDRECSLRKILARHRGMNICINCTSLAHTVSCSSETVENAPERKETHQNMSLVSNGVDSEHSLQKIMTRLCGTNFHINCTKFRAVAKRSQMNPNGKKRTKT